MYSIYHLVHIFLLYNQIFRRQVLYTYLMVFRISNLIYGTSTTVQGALFFPKFFDGHPIYILPLLLYTSSLPSLPLHHLLFLVSAVEFSVL
jgi:hypothetical protein